MCLHDGKCRFNTGAAIKIFNSPITAGILAISFFIAAHFFQTGYHHYLFNQEKKDSLLIRLRMARQQQSETKHKKQIFLQVKTFLEQAKSLKLEKENWSVYDINITGPVTFLELSQILNQCTNTTSFYFKPITFHVKSAEKPEKDINKKIPPSKQTDSSETKTGDILLTLRGAFIVREE